MYVYYGPGAYIIYGIKKGALLVREEKAVKSVFLCNARGEFNIKRIKFCVHQRNNIYWSAVLKIPTRLILAKLFSELTNRFCSVKGAIFTMFTKSKQKTL